MSIDHIEIERPALAGPLLDHERFAAKLKEVARGDKARPAIVALLKEELAAVRKEAERRLTADGEGTRCATALSHVMDTIIQCLFDLARSRFYPASNQSHAERITVVAVGGYGRGTLAPGSDIDLLFILPYKQTGWSESVIEFILYALWDTRLKVGHATRSVDECLRLAQSDTTILTAILEARYICGEESLFNTLTRRFRKEIAATGARAFIASKLAERDQRHKKSGESRYLVEPDVKNGKGGLRDLNTLFWIAKFIAGSDQVDDLVSKGLFSQDEVALFRKSENFLWAVRCHLHFISGRSEDRLSFDRQPDLAVRLGYKAHGGLKHVERFMKHYFLVAKDVGDLTRILSASLEARQMKEVPGLGGLLVRLRPRRAATILDAPGFRIEANRLTIESDKVFASNPVNLIRLFAVSADKDIEIHPDALKAVRRNLGRIDKTFCAGGEANALFMSILTESRDPETALRRMNEAGVLGRFIPDFGKIVALVQFNMYHHYTVDEHLIRAVGILSDIDHGEFSGDHPLSTQIFPTLASRRALYVALLLHDIAKGRKEDHSIAGERVAKALCPRLGLTPQETEMVAWLIRYHLLMSETAQTRDLNDFKTILDFANIVQSPERLKLLLILTVADIRAVGPNVWNGWKGQLLRTLYYETEPVLSGGHSTISHRQRVAASQAQFFAHYPTWSEEQRKAYAARHYDPYWLNVETEQHLAHERLMSGAKAKGEAVATEVTTDRFTAITALTVYAPDHPRFLAIITGACAAASANIAGAQIFTTADGMALDTILIQRHFEDEQDERRRAERVATLVRQALTGEIWLKDMIGKVQHPESRLQAFTVPPRVIIDNDSSNRYTVIEVNGRDRIGLLYDLTEAIYGLNLNIASAHIATFGERAVDVFYVTDLTGAKIVNPSRHAQIERKLTLALEAK